MRVYLGPDNALGPSEMARWSGAKGKAAPAPSPSAAPKPQPAPPPEFSAPSPLGIPNVVPAGVWEAADDDEETAQGAAESGWQDLMFPRVDPDDDVLIELE
jgi:hypothetical protein